MKYLVLLCDGMSDHKIKELNNKTILEYADTSNFDKLAKKGECGLIYTVPDGMHPGSDICNLSIFGFDPKIYYSGRSPLEAASLGIDINDNDYAFRCNIVTLSEDRKKMLDFSAFHINDELSLEVMGKINRLFNNSGIEFYHGVGYRNLMVIRDRSFDIKTTAPHDIMGLDILEYLPSGNGADTIIDIMNESGKIFKENSYADANGIWLWGEGTKPELKSYKSLYGLDGSVVAAVDLIKGIGIHAGLKIVDVPGATGFLDTNFEGKAEYAIDSLSTCDYVFVHVEAPDEAGHMGSIEEKIKAVENINSKMLPVIMEGLEEFKDYRILVTPDHPTPVYLRTHVAEPVPAIISGSKVGADSNSIYNEFINPSFCFREGHKIADYFLEKGNSRK